MFNPILPIDRGKFKFNGFYRGVVVDVSDPKKAGRIKVRIYPVFKDLEVEDIPWAIYADPAMGGASNIGSINVPVLNAHVFCFFEGGDHRYPVYFAGAPAIKNGTPDSPSESRTNGTYPQNKVYKSENGIIIEIDDTNGNERYKITHPAGITLTMDSGGNLNISTSADTNISTSGDTNITASGNVNVTGTTINLN